MALVEIRFFIELCCPSSCGEKSELPNQWLYYSAQVRCLHILKFCLMFYNTKGEKVAPVGSISFEGRGALYCSLVSLEAADHCSAVRAATLFNSSANIPLQTGWSSVLLPPWTHLGSLPPWPSLSPLMSQLGCTHRSNTDGICCASSRVP